MDNLKEVDKFQETNSLLRPNQEETGNLNKTITNKIIKAVIKKLSTNKSLGLDGFTDKFYQTFKEELTSLICPRYPMQYTD